MKKFICYCLLIMAMGCKNPTPEYSDYELKRDMEEVIQMSIKLNVGTIITTTTDLYSPFPKHIKIISSNSYMIIKPLNLVYTKW